MGVEPVILTSYNGPERNIFDDIECASAENTQDTDGELASTSYVLCFVQRSGSTMLAELMGQTNILGQPLEYLNPRGPMWWDFSRGERCAKPMVVVRITMASRPRTAAPMQSAATSA